MGRRNGEWEFAIKLSFKKPLPKNASGDDRNFYFSYMTWFGVVLNFIEIYEIYSICTLNSTSASKWCLIADNLHVWLVVAWKLVFCKHKLALWYGCMYGNVLPEPPTPPWLSEVRK